MFDDYAKKLKNIGANVPKVFKKVAKLGANKFRNEAVKITDREKLVDTGNYRRNWNGEAIEPEQGVYGIAGINTVDYASHLEYGHKLRNGGRWKGRFVGREALEETEFYCLEQLDKTFEKLYTDYQKGFTTPEE